MKSPSAADDRIRLFLSYAGLRLRLFLHEILQLHQRFLVAFLYFFGLILSGNEQIALRESVAHLLSPEPWTLADLIYLASFLLYGWVVAAVVRRSARGGRVHYFAESLPLPFAWERAVRAMALTVVNLTIIILCGMGWHQLMKNGGAWPMALLLWATYYIWILGLQLSLLEQNWRLFPFWILGAFLLALGKGTPMLWPGMGLTAAFAVWSFHRQESKAHDHPELPLGTWETRLRSAITRRFPDQLMMQISYSLAKPALLIYCILLAGILNIILWMVLKQSIPVSQKIYVYTCITGVLSLLLSSFFRNFHLQRNEWQTWLNSLPRPDSWWLTQDTWFVSLLYLLLTGPFSLALIMGQLVPALVPVFVLPVQVLGFFILRSMQRSLHIENSFIIILGMSIWFILLGYLCDHGLQWLFG